MHKSFFLLSIAVFSSNSLPSGKDTSGINISVPPTVQPTQIHIHNTINPHNLNNFYPSNQNLLTSSDTINATSNATANPQTFSSMSNQSVNSNKTQSFNVSINTNTNKNSNKQRMRQQQELLNQTMADGAQALGRNWYYVMGMAIAATYGFIFSRLAMGKRLLKKKGTWMRWKNHLSLDQLRAIPKKTIELELVTLIQKKYISLGDPNNFIIPLMRFGKAFNKEYRALREFIAISHMLEQCKMATLFGLAPTYLIMAKKRIKRLLFIRETFLSWSADDRIKQHLHQYKKRKRPVSILASFSGYASTRMAARSLFAHLFKRNARLEPKTPLAEAAQTRIIG